MVEGRGVMNRIRGRGRKEWEVGQEQGRSPRTGGERGVR